MFGSQRFFQVKTSAIITVYNRPAMLAACLQALAGNRALVDEAVVADDGSNPENAAQMQAAFAGLPFPVRYVWQPDQGYRLAAARNNAIRQAAGDYLLMLDCDILLLPEVVALHLRHARPGRFLAANRAWVGEADTHNFLRGDRDAADLSALWERSDRRHLPHAHRQFQRNAWLRRLGLARPNKPKILGCHFSIFRKDVERINGFDENYEGWGLEDDDFATRLHMAGVRGQSLIIPARAMHLWHPAVASCPRTLSESPNYAYYHRERVAMFCRRGLKPQ